MFNTGLIDSLRIRVKLDRVKIIDKRVVQQWLTYYPDIDQLDDDLKNAPPYTKITQGITYRFFPKAFINARKMSEEYMVFQVSAKMLKHRYFEGITMDNVQLIVDGLNQWGAIKITKEALLDGLVSDIDICINQLIDPRSLETAFSLIHQFPKQSKKPLIHFINKQTIAKPFNQNRNAHFEVADGQFINDEYVAPRKVKNLGIDFNKREKATNSTPYCKIYHKGWELLTKSSEFAYYNLPNMRKALHDNLVRYEFTIKNAKHKAYLCEKGFDADFKTFKDLLKAEPAELRRIAMSGLSHYLESQTRSKVDSDLKPMDIMIQYFIEKLIKRGASEDEIFGFTYLIDCKVQRSVSKTRAKKLLTDLKCRDDTIKKKIEANDRATNFLSNLGFEIP